jgi:succinoglycan biosynthesis transport protein ExoP
VEPLTLTELGARMARCWRTLVIGLVMGVALGGTLHLVWPTQFRAVTVIRVDADDPDQVDMAAERAVAVSRRVTTEALDALGDTGLTIRELENAAGATVVKQSRLLHISYSAPTPRAASRGADAVAQAYLAVRSVDSGTVGGPSQVSSVVIDPARTPASPSGPGLLPSALAGGMLGLLAAAVVAAGLSRTLATRAS